MNEIQKTSDYNLFTSFTSNREIDSKHVNRLVRAILSRNLLHINPILVDTQMRIIDGQHRPEAAKILKVPVYYIVCDTLKREDISRLNSNQKNWNTLDFINFYTIEGKIEFLKLSKFINHYPQLSVSAIICIISENHSRNTKSIREGILELDEIEEGHRIAQACIVLHDKYASDFVYDSRFPVAFARALKHENFDLETFIKRIDINPRAFVRCVTIKDSMKMIEEIYNYRVSKNLISL